MGNRLNVWVLGPPKITIDKGENNSEEIRLSKLSEKARVLLAYIIWEQERHSKSKLQGHLWPKLGPDGEVLGEQVVSEQPGETLDKPVPPRLSTEDLSTEDTVKLPDLNNALSKIRQIKSLKPLLFEDKTSVGLNVDKFENVWVDAYEFEVRIKAALQRRDLDELRKVHKEFRRGKRGEFLEGITGLYSVEFSRWVAKQREYYLSLVPKALDELTTYLIRRNKIGDAISAAREWVEFDQPYGSVCPKNPDRPWVILMRLYGYYGLKDDATALFSRYEQAVKDWNDDKE